MHGECACCAGQRAACGALCQVRHAATLDPTSTGDRVPAAVSSRGPCPVYRHCRRQQGGGLGCVDVGRQAPVSATAAAAQVVQGTLRPERPTRIGTASTVNVPVNAPLEAVVYSKPIACSVYPPERTQGRSLGFRLFRVQNRHRQHRERARERAPGGRRVLQADRLQRVPACARAWTRFRVFLGSVGIGFGWRGWRAVKTENQLAHNKFQPTGACARTSTVVQPGPQSAGQAGKPAWGGVAHHHVISAEGRPWLPNVVAPVVLVQAGGGNHLPNVLEQ